MPEPTIIDTTGPDGTPIRLTITIGPVPTPPPPDPQPVPEHPGLATMRRDWTTVGAHDLQDVTPQPAPNGSSAPVELAGAVLHADGRTWEAHADLTLRNVLTYKSVRANGGARVTATDSTLACQPSGPGLHLTNCRIGSFGDYVPGNDGLNPCTPYGRDPGVPHPPAVIEGCLVIREGPDALQPDGRRVHADGIQVWWQGPLVIRRNRIEGWSTSCLMLKSEYGHLDDVLVEGNHLIGRGSFTVYVREHTAGLGRPTNVTIRYNVFDGTGSPISTGNRPDNQATFVRSEAERLQPEWIVWHDNVRPDGTEIEPPGGWHTP